MLLRSFRPHPFRLLFALEWILISLAALRLFGAPRWFQRIQLDMSGGSLSINLWLSCVLLIFGLMGVRLPSGAWAKVLYIATSLGLISVIASQSAYSISPLLIILLLRGCLIFRTAGRWFTAGAMGLIYPLSLAPVWLAIWLILRLSDYSDWTVDIDFIDLAVMPNGDLQLNLSPDQVQQGLKFLQNIILSFLAEETLTFGLIVLFVVVLVNSFVRERHGRRQLATAYEQLYQYSLQVENQATLQERTRIARDIHDSLGHLLTTQNVLLQNAALSLKTNPDEVSLFLRQSRQLSANALDELRQSVQLLRGDSLQGQTLEDAVLSLIEDFHQTTGICPDVDLLLKTPLPNRMQVAVYRIVEESLTNVRKYSAATQVDIRIQVATSRKRSEFPMIEPDETHAELLLQIEDNGRGFQVEQNSAGFGIRGMQERAVSLGGRLEVLSQPGAGCRVTATFPLPRNIL